MYISSLWISILAFTLLGAGNVTAWRFAVQMKKQTEILYAALLSVYNIWLILYTFILFTNVYVMELSAQALASFGMLRTLFTIIILVLYSYLSISTISSLSAATIYLICLVPALVYLLSMLIFFTSITVIISAAITLLYALVLFFVSAAGLQYSQNAHILRIRRFFIITAIYQLSMIILSIPSIYLYASPFILVFPRALFCGALGISELICFFRYENTSTTSHPLPENMFQQYGLTKREQEIAELVQQGLPVKTIAGHLFISPRTVETHITNMYNKCGCSSRGEFLHLLYSPAPKQNT